MRYWVYINNKVDGPYDENKLVTLNGFSQNTLICSEEVASNGGQEWVKASSVFEFDEVPVQEPVAMPQPATHANTPAAHAGSSNQDVLLSKLNSLTDELSYLHKKLDSMQTHLDKAIEQNERLSQQLALQTAAAAAAASQPAVASPKIPEENLAPAPAAGTGQEPAAVAPVHEQNLDNVPDAQEQVAPKEEEELIIRSALDSIYGGKPIQQPADDETFQDLLPEKEAEKVEKIEEELTFTPEESAPQENVVKEALITTPSAEEASRDALINELTASPKEDVLDQIIQEHQKEESHQLPVGNPAGKDSSWKGAAATGAAVAGLAGLAALSANKDATPAASEEAQTPFTMATDRNNPDSLETVLPADQMPADAAPAAQKEKITDLPSLEAVPETNNIPGKQEDQFIEPPAEAADVHENTVQELVPGVSLKKEEKEVEGIYDLPLQETEPAAQPQTDQPQAEADPNALTAKDLEDAFGPQTESFAPTITEVPDNQNPNDLTEIELKEGSTYLISDFVPPAQVGDDAAALDALNATLNQSVNKQQETIIQDMLAVSNKAEKTQLLPTDGLPEDAEATRVSLENTIQAKRGASLDIKTAPMVPEPADSPRLDVDLDDVNAQHDLKTSSTGMKLTKIVIGALVGLLLLIILYVVLGIMNLLPQSMNIFSKKQAAPAATITQEILQDNNNEPSDDFGAEEYEEEGLNGEILSSVQNFALPNDMTLKQLVQSKHPTISENLISWEVADAIDPDNYAITIKVPPENPQNFKTVYRFNYNADNGLLEPTISDAKNLLDQAYGTQA